MNKQKEIEDKLARINKTMTKTPSNKPIMA